MYWINAISYDCPRVTITVCIWHNLEGAIKRIPITTEVSTAALQRWPVYIASAKEKLHEQHIQSSIYVCKGCICDAHQMLYYSYKKLAE